MINSEDKVRLALQMVAIVMVWVAGLEWVAAVLLATVLPWTPLYPALKLIAAVGGWMATPVADKIDEALAKTQESESTRGLLEVLKAG